MEKIKDFLHENVLLIFLFFVMVSFFGIIHLKTIESKIIIEESYNENNYRAWCKLYQRSDITYDEWVFLRKNEMLHSYRK